MNDEDFAREYKETVEKAMRVAQAARLGGLLAAESLLDEDRYAGRDVLELGLRLVMDGTDPRLIDKILSNIVNLETDSGKKTLKTIQKEAALAIQEGMNPKLLLLLLNSYVDVDIEESLKAYNDTGLA